MLKKESLCGFCGVWGWVEDKDKQTRVLSLIVLLKTMCKKDMNRQKT